MEDERAYSRMSVTVTKDGPYAVSGGPPLSRQTIDSNHEGESVDWLPGKAIPTGASYFLCRCGHSANKPFCDGSHVKVGFDGKETADHEPYAGQSREIDGPTMALTDAESLCAFARFCDREGKVWHSVLKARTSTARDAFEHQVGQCPSGRLVAWDLATRQPIEPQLPPSIVLIEDPREGVSGPVWVRGGIKIIAVDGFTYEVRNRVTLCRCGQSRNKPFCDGTHASVGFKDE
jgi:CDGSH-type Zn-finger protein